MKRLTWLLLVFLTAAPICAKPKVDVRVRVKEAIGRDHATDSLSKSGASSTANTTFQTVWFLNVTVLSDNSEAVAKNNGEWCIRGDAALDGNTEYHGTLDGNTLELQMPVKNGKTKKEQFDVLDHKWRKLSDL
jgi:hypothetical protein